jgi:putative oxidoreductase
MAYGLLLLRAFTGAAFAGHGTQKLFGWFGGHGPQGTGGFFSSLGYHPGVRMAVIAGLGEAVGGTLLAFGFLTPAAGTLVAIVMLNAIAAATLKKQFLLGSELELLYLVIGISLVATGPGRFSVDRALGWDDNITGLWWAVGALVVAAMVSAVTLTTFRSKPAPQAATQP